MISKVFYQRLILGLGLLSLAGCIANQTDEDRSTLVSRYQKLLEKQGPLHREMSIDTNEPNDLIVSESTPEQEDPLAILGLVRPTGRSSIKPPDTDPNFIRLGGDFRGTAPETLELTLTGAIGAALRNSPEVRVISFDPAIAREEIQKQIGRFDLTAFGRLNHDETDKPTSSISEIGQAEVSVFESGIKQASPYGSEWSASYVLTHSWDDLVTRNPPTRYQPVLMFQLKQPLWRDRGQVVNLAGVNIARLEHNVALLSFQQRAEELGTETIVTYWQLVQARHDRQTYRDLLSQAEQTLDKVQGRRQIDATDVQVRQAMVSLNQRRALVLQAEKRVKDVQDNLIRLMSDPVVDLLDETTVIPVSEPYQSRREVLVDKVLALALHHNPVMRQAKLRVEIAEINLDVAEHQKLPRLDLVASARTEGLDRQYGEAHDVLGENRYHGYGLGLALEIPLGNRVRKSELAIRTLERSRAVTAVQNIADQVAVQIKERIRRIESSFAEIAIQQDAVDAAMSHLVALDDTEQIRERLTPEFLLVKLQAQDALANAQRSHTKAVVDYNIALALLAQTTGHVLQLHQVTLPDSVREE